MSVEVSGDRASLAFRGNRHAPDMWARLLPGARTKLVEAGLFTADGKITKLGLQSLKDMD